MLPAGGVQRAGRHVAAVTAKFAQNRGMAAHFLSLNDPHGLHVVRVGQLEFSIAGYAGNKFQFVRAALRAARCNPKLVFAMHPHLAPILSTMKLPRRKFRSIVITHGVEVWQPLGLARGNALRQADLIIGPSTDTVKQLIDVQHVSVSKVQRLAWGLDPEFEARVAARTSAMPPAGFPLEARAILAVGRWNAAEKYKGADTLISALPGILKITPDAALVLVGDGDDRPRLEQHARDVGVSERTYFLSGLRPEELFACYANCEIFCLPSRGEGFGLVFLEAMAHGKPVVGGAHGGIPDIIEEGVTGRLVPYGDVERLTDTLGFLFSHPDLAREMGARGKLRVAQIFSFAQFESQLTMILDHALPQETPNA